MKFNLFFLVLEVLVVLECRIHWAWSKILILSPNNPTEV